MSRKKRPEFDTVGITPEGKKVVSGVFRVFDTIGLPLDVIFDLCEQENLMPSWTHFYDDAIKEKTIYNRLETNVSDVYGKPFWLEVKKRLELYIRRIS